MSKFSQNIKKSVGIIPYKIVDGKKLFFIGHPGGARNVNAKWSYLKGCMENDEDLIETAIREFREECGVDLSQFENDMVYVGQVQQSPRKIVYAFAIDFTGEFDIDPKECKSNLCEEGWPEIDKYAWMTYDEVQDCAHPKHMEFYKAINIM